MDNFAFIIHPVDPKRDVQRKYPWLGKLLPVPAIDFFSRYFPPVYISHITGIISLATGKEIEGWFIACPYTPKQMVSLPPETVYNKVIATGKLAQKLGAKILGLGGFTSVVGDAGLTVAKHLDIPVTTGDSYTIAVAVEATLKAAQRMNINPAQATAAVVGATGSQPGASGLVQAIQRRLERDDSGMGEYRVRDEQRAPLCACQADMVLTVTNAIEAVIEPQHLKSGVVVCDVARPRDVSRQVIEARNDVLVIEGGMVRVPGPVNFNFDFGFPSGMAYACMAETITLALEGLYQSYTLGKDISLEQVDTISTMATKHGFQVSGFRSFELAITDEQIDQIKQNAYHQQAQLNWANS